MKRIKYQTKLVTIPQATPAGSTLDTSLQPDKAYNRCVGIAIHQVSDGGIANGYYRVGLKDQNRSYHELSHVDNLKAGSEVAPDQKFKTVDVPIQDGILLDIQTNIPAALSSNLSYEVVLKLVDDLVEIQ